MDGYVYVICWVYGLKENAVDEESFLFVPISIVIVAYFLEYIFQFLYARLFIRSKKERRRRKQKCWRKQSTISTQRCSPKPCNSRRTRSSFSLFLHLFVYLTVFHGISLLYESDCLVLHALLNTFVYCPAFFLSLTHTQTNACVLSVKVTRRRQELARQQAAENAALAAEQKV